MIRPTGSITSGSASNPILAQDATADGLTSRRAAAHTLLSSYRRAAFQMGRIVVRTRITNLSGEGRSIRCDIPVDTGAGALIQRIGW